MRINQDSAHAKSAAKRMVSLSALDVPGTVQMTYSGACEAVARMHGYRDWHELVGAKDAPAATDDFVSVGERAERREQQANVLVSLGYSDVAAAAMVEVVLPSGDFEREMIAATAFVDSHVRGLPKLPSCSELTAAWMCYRLALPKEHLPWALQVSMLRETLDGGLVGAATRMTKRFAERTAAAEDGYYVVVAESRMFYQGFFLSDPGADVIAACDRNVRAALDGGNSTAAFVQMMRAMVESNFTATPGMRSGALQAGLIASALEHPADMLRIAGLAKLLAMETGFTFFIVRLEKELDSGFQTSISEMKVANSGEARAAIAELPEVKRIHAALSTKFGLPKGMPR